MADLSRLRVGIIAADGVEQVEVTAPRDALRQARAHVSVLSPDGCDVRGYHYIEPGDMLSVDGPIAAAPEFDALIVPGGLGGPDTLRKVDAAVSLVRDTARAAKPIGVICHGPWLLIEAGILAGRALTCVPQLSADVTNAGARYLDQDVHIDRDGYLLISGRDHNTAQVFADTLVRELGSAPQ
jgi:protease I